MNSITFFLSFIPILALLLLGINLILAPHNPYQEKSSTFECGFHSFLGQNRTQFNISFFIFGLLFLAFDLELVIALPGLINISGISAYGLSIMLIFFAILTIGFAFELGKKALSIDSRQYDNTKTSQLISSHVIENIITSINMAMKAYIYKFILSRLIWGYIVLRIVTFSLGYVICLCIIPNGNVIDVASYLVLIMIGYGIIITPWGNNKMVNFLVTLIFNCIIISIIMSLIFILIGYSDSLYSTLPISVYLAFNDPFDTHLVLIGSDPLPNDGGPNTGPFGSGNSGGPGNPNKVKLAQFKADAEEKANDKKAILTYIRGWFGLEKGQDLRVNLDDKLAKDQIPSGPQQEALKKAFSLFKETCDEQCKVDSNLHILVDKIKGDNPHPFNPNNSKSLTPEIDRDLRLGITHAEKLIQDYMHKNNINYKHRMSAVDYIIEPKIKSKF